MFNYLLAVIIDLFILSFLVLVVIHHFAVIIIVLISGNFSEISFALLIIFVYVLHLFMQLIILHI